MFDLFVRAKILLWTMGREGKDSEEGVEGVEGVEGHFERVLGQSWHGRLGPRVLPGCRRSRNVGEPENLVLI